MIKIRKSFLVLLLVAFGYALFSGGNLPYSIFYAVFLMILFMGIFTYVLGRKLKVKLEVEKYETKVGEKNSLTIKVSNNSIFMVPYIEIRNSLIDRVITADRGNIISLGSGARKFIKKEFDIKIRGRYTLGETECNISDILGVFSYKKKYNDKKHIRVYPRVYDLFNVKISGANLREFNIRNIKAYNKGPESSETIKNIREYRRGDSYKRINWKVTAKHGKLFVKEYDSSESTRIHLFLDLRKLGFLLDKSGEEEESLVEFYLSLVRYVFMSHGNCESVIVNDRVKSLDIIGESAFEVLKEQMVTTYSDGSGGLSGYLKKYFYEINKKSAVVLVTANISKEDLEYLILIKQDGYEINLFYQNRLIGDEIIEFLAMAKGQGVNCYNIDEIR